jgi:integrase/recombinase XerC
MSDSSRQLPAVIEVTRQMAPDLMWIVPTVEGDEARHNAWQQAVFAWLENKRRKSGSGHTVHAYRSDFMDFFKWFEGAPWTVSGRDAEAWVAYLEDKGLAKSSINRKMAALSSFYEFVSNKFTFVGRDNVERSIFIDDHGNARVNPFKRPNRFKIETYDHSTPLSTEAVRTMLSAINTKTLVGSRDYALLVTYLFTGRRSTEIGQLRWGDLERDELKGRYYYSWHGKGGKSRTDELPAPAYHAIVNFLKVTGRMETIKPNDYIFKAIFTDRAGRLPNVGQVDENRPITGSLINRIVKKRAAAAGIEPHMVHTHTLRHTAASLRYRDGAGEDLLKVSKFLGHSSVSVTQIYLSKLHKPVDDGWREVEQLVLI